jgi:hypothetical protein
MREGWPVAARIELMRKSVEWERVVPEIGYVEDSFGEGQV